MDIVIVIIRTMNIVILVIKTMNAGAMHSSELIIGELNLGTALGDNKMVGQ